MRDTKIIKLLGEVFEYFLFIISLGFVIYGELTKDLSVLLLACVMLYISNTIYGLITARQNIVFLSFQVTFFTFLLGYPTINFLFYKNYGLQFTDSIIRTVILMMYVSQLVLIITVRMPRFLFKRKYVLIKNNNDTEIGFVDVLAKTFTIFFYVTVIFNIIETIMKIRAYYQYGYFGYYTADLNIPTAIVKLSQMNEYFFYGICACLIKKKKIYLPVILFLGEGILTIAMGQRNQVLLRVAFVVIYFVLRSIYDKSWIEKKEKTIFLIAIPIILVFIVTYGYTRIGQNYETSGLLNTIYDLFNSQGNTCNVLAYQQFYKDNLIMNQNFTFGELWTFVTRNVFSQFIFHTKLYSQNTIAMAQYGHSFGQTISYIALKSEYLAGRGYGSSYIAEVMQDYGWFGIIMINIVYGILMKNAKFVKKNEYLVNMFICYMIVGLIYAPRSTAIGPFMKIFSFNAILANIIVWIVAKLIYMRGKKHNV